MILKLLLLCTVMCSVFSASSSAAQASTISEELTMGRFVTAVREIIFRHYPEGSALLKEKAKFQRQYPDEARLVSPDSDRGFNMSVRDPFFVVVLREVSKLVDQNSLGRNPLIRVCDFGCGLGHTSILLALLGTKEQIHVTVIENQMREDELEQTKTFHSYASQLARTLNPGNELTVLLKLGIDATIMPDHEKYAPSNRFHAHFMGNFLHMLDPETAQKMVADHAHRMLRSGGTVYASVDGINTKDISSAKVKEVYLQAKRDGKKFPSVLDVTDYGMLIDDAVQIIEEIPATYSLASVNEAGHTSTRCRQIFPRQLSYNGIPLLFYGLQKTVCFYDSALIEFVFPSSQWNVMIIKKSPSSENDVHCADKDVLKWQIIAQKK